MVETNPPARFTLRKYQLSAEQGIRISMARGPRRIVLYIPTGGGKTLTATSIMKQAVAKGRKVATIAGPLSQCFACNFPAKTGVTST